MKKVLIKMSVLGLLIIGSLFQIVTLWFSDVSERNYFYSFIERGKEASSDINVEKKYILTPRHLIVHLGNSTGEFTIVKRTSKEYEDLFKESMKIITAAIQKGSLTENLSDPSILWSGRSLLYDLTFPLGKEVFAKDLGVGKDFIAPETVKEFAVLPSDLYSDSIRVVLIDVDHQLYTYSLPKEEIKESNNQIITFVNQIGQKSNPYYISSYKDGIQYREGIQLFDHNVLLPLPNDNLLYHEEIYFDQPFLMNGQFDQDALENYINIFFINPGVKWKLEKENEIRFGDDRILIKYNVDGILEYSNSESSNIKTTDLSSAYQVAEAFLEKDRNLALEQGEYYLNGYEITGAEIHFYYGYSYNSFPLVIEDEIMKQYNMKQPMEITVVGNTVTNYKRFLFMQGQYIQQKQVFSSKYEEVLNQFIEDYDIDENQIQDMYLGYFWEDDNTATMQWIIWYQGNSYIYDL